MKAVWIMLVVLSQTTDLGLSLTCVSPKIKVTIKTSQPDTIDEYEKFLFQGVMAYSIRKYCGTHTEDLNCPDNSAINTTDVIISNQTDRFAMCVEVNNCQESLLQEAIKDSQPRFNGALLQTDETLLYDGVPVTLKPEVDPAFPIWLIPFIVFMGLVIIVAIVIISYTVYQSKKKGKSIHSDDHSDKESLSVPVYENDSYRNDNNQVAQF